LKRLERIERLKEVERLIGVVALYRLTIRMRIISLTIT
jgi:hypothetical protein